VGDRIVLGEQGDGVLRHPDALLRDGFDSRFLVAPFQA
jgi:hypothetical protein